jgi:hypothetical protein
MRGFLSTVRRVRGGRVAIAAVSVVLFGLTYVGSALACSCAPAAPTEALVDSDAAIVGRLLGVEPAGTARAKYRYEVLRVYRGADRIEPGSVLSVLSPRGSAACALPDRLDRHYGLFLLAGGGRWASGLCGVVSPHRLWLAAKHPGDGAAAGSVPSCTS